MRKHEQEVKGAHRLRRHVLRLAAVVAVLCLALVARRLASDFPSSWERRISNSLSGDGMAVEVSGVSMDLLPMRLNVGALSVHPPRESNRAALAVSNAVLLLRPRSIAPGANWLREVRVESLDFDADALSSLSGKTDGGGTTPEIGPVGFFIGHVAGFGLEVRDLSGTLYSGKGTIAIEDAAVTFNGRGEHDQTLRGRIHVEPSAPAVEAYGTGDFDFSRLVPTLRKLNCDGIAGELEKFEFPVLPPRVETLFYWAPASQKRSLSVSLQSGPLRYCGVRLSGLSGIVRVGGRESWNRVDIDPLEIRRTEGSASGSLSLDIETDTLSFDCVSMIDPLSLAIMLRLVDDTKIEGIAFENPAEIRGSGSVGIGEGPDSRTSMRFSALLPGATVHGVSFSRIAVSGGMNGGVLEIPKISAGLAGGSLDGSLRMDDGKADGGERSVAASLAMRGVQLLQLSEAFGLEADKAVSGTLDVDANYDGPFAELGGKVPLRGSGAFSADLHDALLFRIPLFAGLTDVLVKYIPGVNFLVDQDEAHIRATLDEGRWTISNFDISGRAFSIDGSGTAASDGTDLNLVARLRILNRKTWLGRCLHFLLSPLSGLLGVRATGDISSPHWASAPFSRSTAK